MLRVYENTTGTDILVINSKGYFVVDENDAVLEVKWSEVPSNYKRRPLDYFEIPENLVEECADCDSGWIEGTCSTCAGSGERNYGPVGSTCRECRGSGEARERCEWCNAE